MTENGYKVHFVESGDKVLSEVHKHKPDLILLDIMMPCVNGWTLFQLLKADERTKSISVIVMTSVMLDPTDKMRTISLGAEDYIVKFPDSNTLLE